MLIVNKILYQKNVFVKRFLLRIIYFLIFYSAKRFLHVILLHFNVFFDFIFAFSLNSRLSCNTKKSKTFRFKLRFTLYTNFLSWIFTSLQKSILHPYPPQSNVSQLIWLPFLLLLVPYLHRDFQFSETTFVPLSYLCEFSEYVWWKEMDL